MVVIGEDDRRFVTLDQSFFLVTLYVVSPIRVLIGLEFSKCTIQELIKFLCERSNGDFALRVENEVDRALVVAFYGSSLRSAFLVALGITLNVLLQSGEVLQVVLDDFVQELFCVRSLSLVSLNLRVQMVLERNS